MKTVQQLSNQCILILSPQDWGKMMLSKHHYACELAKRGNTVYFLNPLKLNGKLFSDEAVHIEQDNEIPGLYRVWYRVYFPYRLKFHAKRIYRWFMKRQLKKILNNLPHPVDIIWSFDLGNSYPFRFLGNGVVKVFHPVDEPLNQNAILSAEGADVIFGVTPEILHKYSHASAPKHLIPHGVSTEFLQAIECPESTKKDKLNIGYSGNLLRPDIDRPVLLKIFSENPHIQFHIWGSAGINDSNIGRGTGEDISKFIDTVKQLPNIQLHGVVNNTELARQFTRMDAFLICYDVNKDQSKGTNYHKIMEYIAAGKIIISNNVTNYKDKPGFVQMVASRNNNEELPALFSEVINKLDYYNNETMVAARKQFAKDNTYTKHLSSIERILSSLQ